MALITGSFSTFSAIGNREDLGDVIYSISPSDTPLMSMLSKTKATNTLHSL